MDYFTTHLASIKYTTAFGSTVRNTLQEPTAKILQKGAEFSRSRYHVPRTRIVGTDGGMMRFELEDTHFHLYSYSIFAFQDSPDVLEGRLQLRSDVCCSDLSVRSPLWRAKHICPAKINETDGQNLTDSTWGDE